MPSPLLSQHRFVQTLVAGFLVAVIIVASSLQMLASEQIGEPLVTTPTLESEALVVDTDGDGISDDDENLVYGTNPLLADTDGDGINDDVEIANGTDPLTAPVPTPTPTLVPPTPTPVPPTQVPTSVPPTQTPVPTSVPSTQTPVSPTPKPTVIPVTPTPVPPSPTPTVVPVTPTPTPVSPTPTRSGDVSPQRIVSGSGCTQVSSSDIVPAGTAVEFRCNSAPVSLFGPVTRTFTGLTTGWQYQVDNGPWRDTVGSEDSVHYFTLQAFTVRLQPTATVVGGSQGAITVKVQTPSIFGGSYTTTLGATRQIVVPTVADVQLVCSPASISGQVNAAQTVSCTYSGKVSLGTRQVTLTRITVPVPAGWSIASPSGTATATTLTITPNATITYNAISPQSYTFSYTLTPGCTAPTTSQPINLTSQFSFGSTTGIAGATFSQVAARSNTSSLAVSVQGNTLVWNEPYSLVDSSVRGTLSYRVSAAGCSGWNIQVSASPFQYTGPNSGTSIPASNLRLTATGNPVVVSGGGTGVSRQAASGPISTPLKVMNATAGSGIGTYQQQLDFNLTIPGRSVAGTYQSTITVTSAAAP